MYPGQHYGTLLEEVNRLLEEGKNVVFDIDVIGGLNIKKQFNDEALALFVQPPSIEVLAQRLERRGTDSSEKIQMRLEKARLEFSQAPNFDHAVINESLDQAIGQAHELILNHIA